MNEISMKRGFEQLARIESSPHPSIVEALRDIAPDLVEMHDCFTIAEIVRMEGLGLIPRGEGAAWTASGRTSLGGALPVNPSGGLLSRGHPVGATGVAQVCEAYWQLTGQAGRRQVEGARLALAYCKGGTVSGTDGGSVTTVVVSA